MSIRLAWSSPEKPVERSQAWRRSAPEEAIARPKESVVSSLHRMVNLAASRLSVMAWERMAQASSGTMGSMHVRVPQGV